MATQAVISVTREGNTLLKIVSGACGENASKLADALKKNIADFGIPSPEDAYEMAMSCGFDCPESLVVLARERIVFRGDGELSPLYVSSFDTPWFNPRWQNGSADYVELISF